MDFLDDEIEQREVESLLNDIDNDASLHILEDTKKEKNDSFNMSEEEIFENSQVGDDGWVSPLSSPLPGPKFTALKTPELFKESIDPENLEVCPCPIPFIPHIELAKSSASQMQSPVVAVKNKECCQIHFEPEKKPKTTKNNTVSSQYCLDPNVSTQSSEFNKKDFSVVLQSLAARMSQSESSRVQIEKFVPYKKSQRRRSLDMTLNVSSASRQQIKALIDCDLNSPRNIPYNATWKTSKPVLQRGNSLDVHHKPSMTAALWEQPQNAVYAYGETLPTALRGTDDIYLSEKVTGKGHLKSFGRRHSTFS